jgi:cytochrome-b5 reductase
LQTNKYPTAAILVLSWPKGSWTPVIRPYTPISDLNKPGHVDFLIKKYPNGKQSSHIHSLQPGDCLYFLAPLKGYSWTANKFPHVTLIAGGAGITPIYQLAKGILDNPEDNTSITMILGVNGDQDVLLKQEFDHWRKQFPERFQAVYTASKPIEGSELRKGYVNAELLKEVVKMKDNDMIFVCGPPAMEKTLCGEKSLKGVLEELGYRKDQVHRF